MEVRAWPPYVAGAIVGLLQFPLVLIIGDTLGESDFVVSRIQLLWV